MRTVFEHSAGGVVTLTDGSVVVIQTKNLRGETVFGLPKGRLEPGESAVEAATREVHEETGLEHLERVATLTPSEYWYARDGMRVRKRVDWYHFVAAEAPGDGFDRSEIDAVLVLSCSEALTTLTYDSERALVEAICG